MKDEIGNSSILGTRSIPSLIVSIGGPIMLSMAVQALYNVVDGIFVSRISMNALTAVSLAFPVQGLAGAVFIGIGAGTSSVISKALGEKMQTQAERAAGTSVTLMLINWLFFAIVGYYCSEWYMRTQTTDAEIIELGTIYLSTYIRFCVGQGTQILFERHLQACGHSVLSMIAQASGAILNMILDPIMIFGLLGCPAMGIRGAVIATIIGQFLSAFLAVLFCLLKNKELPVRIKYLLPDMAISREILSIGAGSGAPLVLGAFMTFGVNKIVIGFSADATAAYAIYYKVQSLAIIPVTGLCTAIIPIISYNYGAGKNERMKKAIWISFVFNIIYMFVFTLFFALFPRTILSWFGASAEVTAIGIHTLRTIGYGFVFYGITSTCIVVLQIFKHWKLSVFVTVFRQLVPALPLIYLVSLLGDLKLLWWSFPLLELLGAAIGVMGTKRVYCEKVINFNSVSAIKTNNN